MLDLKIIIGSTRQGRSADLVAPWVIDQARAHDAFEVDVLDLRDWTLPLFAETRDTIGDRTNPTYSDPIVREWNTRMKSGDAFLVITTEYMHSVPGELKNAIDTLFVSAALRNKPMGFVGYSVSPIAAARAVEHLALIAVEGEAAPLRNTVLIGQVQQNMAGGVPANPMTQRAMGIVLDDLAWWGNVLQAGRAAGELPPASAR